MKNMCKDDISIDIFENVLSELENTPWVCDVENAEILQIAKDNFEKLSFGATQNRNLVRLTGQSGSGKTTQLLPATLSVFRRYSLNPIHFSVRSFAPLHPNFQKILAENGRENLREITNAFALRCLLFSLYIALSQGYDIVFEVTLLDKSFENFVFESLNHFGYTRLMLTLSVNKAVSDYLISARQKKQSSVEFGRVVSSSSADYFYKTLTKSLSDLSLSHPHERVIIFSAYDFQPVYDGEIENALPVFLKTQKKATLDFNDESALLVSKTQYLVEHFTPNLL